MASADRRNQKIGRGVLLHSKRPAPRARGNGARKGRGVFAFNRVQHRQNGVQALRGHRSRVPPPRRERRGLFGDCARLQKVSSRFRRVQADFRKALAGARVCVRRPRAADSPGVEARPAENRGADCRERARGNRKDDVRRSGGFHIRVEGRRRGKGPDMPRGLECQRARRKVAHRIPSGAQARRRGGA